MMIKLAPSLLLSVLCSDESAAFNVVRPTVTAPSAAAATGRHQTQLFMSNDFDTDYDVNANQLTSRRNALARFAATAVASASFLNANPAFAADDKPAPEFSESPTSEASIARMGYDGKGAPPPAPVAAPVAPAPVAAVAAPVAAPAPEAKKATADFDGNEAGSVGSTDEGTQPGILKKFSGLDPKITIPTLPGMNSKLADVDPKYLVGGSVAFVVGTVALLGGGGEEEAVATPAPVPSSAPAPPAAPYGMSAGRNYFNGVDMNAAKTAGLVATLPPKKVEAPKVVVAAPPAAAKAEVEEEEIPSWKLRPPVPYGLQNSDGKNPFIKNIEEYCEGGKVTPACSQTIKGYLDNISITGAAATNSEVKLIVGYLDSLDDESTSSAPGNKKAGAAFTSYLDALSEGSAPPPSSAKAVKTYLDTLKGMDAAAAVAPAPVAKPVEAAPAAPEPVVAPIVEVAPEPVPEPAAPAWEADFSEFDGRLTTIEGRVTSLESKVDEIPDKVFEKIEALQSAYEERLSNEVKKIVEAMTSIVEEDPEPLAEIAVPVPEPEPVVVPVPKPQAPSVPATPIVGATPLVGAIPNRSSMPQPGSGPKKGYGFGGRSPWKDTNPPVTEPAAVAQVAPAPEPIVVPQVVPEPAAPAVPANPLVGAIPERSGMPQPGAGPKKGYGFGGGSSWKNMSP